MRATAKCAGLRYYLSENPARRLRPDCRQCELAEAADTRHLTERVWSLQLQRAGGAAAARPLRVLHVSFHKGCVADFNFVAKRLGVHAETLFVEDEGHGNAKYRAGCGHGPGARASRARES